MCVRKDLELFGECQRLEWQPDEARGAVWAQYRTSRAVLGHTRKPCRHRLSTTLRLNTLIVTPVQNVLVANCRKSWLNILLNTPLFCFVCVTSCAMLCTACPFKQTRVYTRTEATGHRLRAKHTGETAISKPAPQHSSGCVSRSSTYTCSSPSFLTIHPRPAVHDSNTRAV